MARAASFRRICRRKPRNREAPQISAPGLAHISADTVSGSSASGHVVYAGHARLWQGDSILEADQIEVWRDEKKMQATGHVVAAFPQAASPLDASFGGRSGPREKPQSGPTLWTVRAPTPHIFGRSGQSAPRGRSDREFAAGLPNLESLWICSSRPREPRQVRHRRRANLPRGDN